MIFLNFNPLFANRNKIRDIMFSQGSEEEGMKLVVLVSLVLSSSLVQSHSLWDELENIFDDYNSFVNKTGHLECILK